jgi:hypothetical protein
MYLIGTQKWVTEVEWAGENKSDPGFREEYLQEMLRLEGRGDAASQGQCMSCLSTDAAYRCEDCMSRLLECSSCCLTWHRHLPLHVIQVSLVRDSRIGLPELWLALEWVLLREGDPQVNGPSRTTRSH